MENAALINILCSRFVCITYVQYIIINFMMVAWITYSKISQ